MVRQNILISNCNKSDVYNLSNDIYMNFPINLFFKQPHSIELVNFDLNAEVTVLGNSNNTCIVQYKGETYIIVVEFDNTIKNDYLLTQAIQTALNNPRDPNNINNTIIYNGSKWKSIIWSSDLQLYVATAISGDGNRIMSSPDTINWKYSDSVVNNNWTSIIWVSELNKFIVVGKGNNINRIMISSNGYNWAAVPSPNDNDWECICWSPSLNLLVAVSSSGLNNRVMTSSDGINWTIRTTPTNNWQSVCWSSSLNLFIAVANSGYNNRVMTSSNGINWTSRTVSTNNNWVSVASSTSSNLVVAVANNGDINKCMYSSNGINWTVVPAAGDYEWNSVIWCSFLNIFISVASSGIGNRVMTSSNCINWDIQTTPIDISWQTLTSSNNLITGLASDGTSNRVMTSTDSVNWILKSDASNFNWQSVCWSNKLDLFVAVASSGNITYKANDSGFVINSRIMTSIDGRAWLASKMTIFNNWSSICWANSISTFIAVSNTGTNNRVITTLDTITWTNRTSPNNDWTSVCWSNNLNIAVAVANSGTNNRIMTSYDSIVWTSRTSPADNNWTSVCVGKVDVGLIIERDLFVAVASSGSNRVMISEDGINWSLQNAATNNNWTSVCWSNTLNLFAAVSSNSINNRVMTSPDGINWTSQVSAANNEWTSICWSPYFIKFIAVSQTGNNNRIMTSVNGINWVTQTSVKNYEWSSVCYSMNYIIAVSKTGEGDRIMLSENGTTWESVASLQPTELVFKVSESSIEHVLTSFRVERESFTSSYTINSSNLCTISFNHKDSIGPLIGFGNGIYNNITDIYGISTQSISSYYYIDVYNESGNTNPAQFPNYNDINCKMALFDSNGNYIPNTDNPNDLTISINHTEGLRQYTTIGEILKIIEAKMNSYKNLFSPAADFVLEFDYNSNKIIITNYTGAIFGFGFDFEYMNIPNSGITSGSLHSVLGFKKRTYLNVVSVVSDYESQSFDNLFADDYLLICSNITSGASDLNIIGIGNADNVKNNNALFAIPLSQISHFSPSNSLLYKIDISNSPFSLGYKNKTFTADNPNLVNFYLRLLSGRHISAGSNYTMQLSFEF
jgi:hypothetical protein